jgi:carbon-monoxide dehydrogenase medium subunit
VKPAPFTYHAPSTLDDAVALLAAHGDDAKVLAGGQSLVPLLALRLAQPSHLVDIGRIPELGRLEVTDASVVIGAAVTQRHVERAPAVVEAAPVLVDALGRIGHPQIRNRGTVCGSVAHADPAAELPAVMLALDATMQVHGPGGRRDISAADFFVSYLETALGADDVLVSVTVPRLPAATAGAVEELSRRHGDFALAGAVAVVRLAADDTATDVRLSFFGVAATPVRAREAEALGRGRPLDDATIAAIADAAAAPLDPPHDIHATGPYRKHVAAVLARRALTTARERAAGRRVGGA